MDKIEIQSAGISPLPPVEATRLEKFSKTATAAKMSGTYHETAGLIKRSLGKLSGDSALEDDGRNQQFLGKIHRLVGSFRSARSRLLDGLSEFIDEIKKVILK